MKKILLIGASLAALLTAPALAVQATDVKLAAPKPAQTRADVQKRVAERFAMIDANKDGAVTQAEIDTRRAEGKAKRQEMRAAHREKLFAALDTDKNGSISKAEFNAPRPDRADRAERGERGERGGKHWGGKRGHRGHFAGGPGGGWGGRGGMGAGGWMMRLDANKDGKVTLAEATKPALDRFDRADTNKDGTLTQEERKAAREAMRAEWQAKRS